MAGDEVEGPTDDFPKIAIRQIPHVKSDISHGWRAFAQALRD